MIRRSTWVFVFLLVALVGLSFYLRSRDGKEEVAATPTESMVALFPASLGGPSMVRVEGSDGAAIEIERNADGTWVLNAPEAAAADQAAAEAAATQIGDLRVLSTVDLAPDIIGLDEPAYTISVSYAGGEALTLLVGSVTPIKDGYYAQLEGGSYQVVDKYGIDQLIELLTSPPYLQTPTPDWTPTPVITVTPTANLTSSGTADPAITALPQASPPGTATP